MSLNNSFKKIYNKKINKEENYNKILERINYKKRITLLKKEAEKRKLKIAFLTMYKTDCQCFSLFEKMLQYYLYYFMIYIL